MPEVSCKGEGTLAWLLNLHFFEGFQISHFFIFGVVFLRAARRSLVPRNLTRAVNSAESFYL